MKVTVGGESRSYRTVSFDAAANEVLLIEQRLLPHSFEIIRTQNFSKTAQAITNMIVRGAGAIGATAAYGLAQAARAFTVDSGDLAERHLSEHQSTPSLTQFERFELYMSLAAQILKEARPTAVDPANAIDKIMGEMREGNTISDKQEIALREAQKFAEEDVRHCHEIGEHGVHLIREGSRVLTHCNAGWLAFVDMGSATAPIYAAHKAGRKFHVYCSETRPRCQGASLTAWELAQEGVSHQVVSDNAAGHLMQRGQVDLVIVGADRVLGRTGDVANKIGTYTRAVLAHRHDIPFYVAIPLSTIDWELGSGFDIPIEERDESEVLGAWGINAEGKREYVRVANPTSHAVNPGFDVTPAELITGIITPAGIFKPGELWKNRALLGGQE